MLVPQNDLHICRFWLKWNIWEGFKVNFFKLLTDHLGILILGKKYVLIILFLLKVIQTQCKPVITHKRHSVKRYRHLSRQISRQHPHKGLLSTKAMLFPPTSLIVTLCFWEFSISRRKLETRQERCWELVMQSKTGRGQGGQCRTDERSRILTQDTGGKLRKTQSVSKRSGKYILALNYYPDHQGLTQKYRWSM